jgi:nicotinamidase-related amidase
MDGAAMLTKIIVVSLFFAIATSTYAADADAFKLTARYRTPDPSKEGEYKVAEKALDWNAKKTAVIVIDMWNTHWCNSASRRTGELAPRINQFVVEARKRGATIIHAPSDTMKTYADHPARKRAMETPVSKNLPAEITKWCKVIPSEEKGKYPIDQTDGGCDCEPTCKSSIVWTHQIDEIKILDTDYISDKGAEVWSVMEQLGLDNAIIFGVHTNMCVLGRPFGLRNLSRYGKNVVLVRDLTDTMYNPKSWPNVNHFKGTDLIVEHTEKFVAPTITSDQVLGGKPYRFKDAPEQ